MWQVTAGAINLVFFYVFLRSSADDPSKPFEWFVQPFLDPTSQAGNVLYHKRLETDNKLGALLTGTDAAVVVSHASQHHLTQVRGEESLVSCGEQLLLRKWTHCCCE